MTRMPPMARLAVFTLGGTIAMTAPGGAAGAGRGSIAEAVAPPAG